MRPERWGLGCRVGVSVFTGLGFRVWFFSHFLLQPGFRSPEVVVLGQDVEP